MLTDYIRWKRLFYLSGWFLWAFIYNFNITHNLFWVRNLIITSFQVRTITNNYGNFLYFIYRSTDIIIYTYTSQKNLGRNMMDDGHIPIVDQILKEIIVYYIMCSSWINSQHNANKQKFAVLLALYVKI